MKKTKKGFSFIEILVVIFIISIISGVSLFSIDNFLQKTSLDQKISFIKNQKKQLDLKLGKSITDYKFFFNQNKEIYIYENTFSKDVLVSYSSSGSTGSIKVDCNNDKSYFLKLYKDEKFLKKYFLFCNQEISFPLNGNYKILSDELNNIYVLKFVDGKEILFSSALDIDGKIFNNLTYQKDLRFYESFQDKDKNYLSLKYLDFGNFKILDF